MDEWMSGYQIKCLKLKERHLVVAFYTLAIGTLVGVCSLANT